MEQFDVAVIGGGLLGCAASYYLSKAEARVLLLEKGQLNRQASGQNAGSLHFQLEHRMVEYGQQLAEQFALSIPLNLEAEQTWSRLEEELGGDLEIVQDGGLVVAETREQISLLRKKQALEHSRGLKTQLLTGEEARNIAPYLSRTVQAAGFYPREGHANPRLVTPAFARAAAQLGASIRVQTRVNGLCRKQGRWQIHTDTQPAVCADMVLAASGAWTGEVAALANINLPVIPVPLSMMATEVVSPTVSHLIQHVASRLSMKQMRDGNLLLGGGWPSQLHQYNGVFDKERPPQLVFQSLHGNAWIASRVVPCLRQLNVLRAWSGLVGTTPDQIPALGEVTRRPGFYVAITGSGFTLGPTFSRLVSQMMLGRNPDIPVTAYSPARFDHLNPV